MQVTVKTLRHYEQKGLLTPDEVDEWTGYRYYSIDQMQQLKDIRDLQRLGFSLDEIKDLFDDGSHTPTIRQMTEKIRETEAQLKASAQLRMELSQANQELVDVRKETADAWEEKENAIQAAATAKKEAEETEAIIAENQKKADGLKAYIRTFERNVHEYDDAKKWQLPEPDFMMGAGAYRDKKARPLVNKLKDVIKNLTLQPIRALAANERLQQRLKMSDQKVDRLLNRISNLEERNSILEERSHRLELVEHVVGEDQVNRIADEQSRREEREKKQRKRQRNRTEWTL